LAKWQILFGSSHSPQHRRRVFVTDNRQKLTCVRDVERIETENFAGTLHGLPSGIRRSSMTMPTRELERLPITFVLDISQLAKLPRPLVRDLGRRDPKLKHF
jgi:hypothetical protein